MRVVGGAGAIAEHQVVAGALPFDQHLARRPPDQRIEPVQHAGQGADGLGRHVPAADVRDLVHQDVAQAVIVPTDRFGGEEHDRTPQAPGHGRGRAIAPAQPESAARHGETVCSGFGELGDARVIHRAGTMRHTREVGRSRGEEDRQDRGPESPDGDGPEPVVGRPMGQRGGRARRRARRIRDGRGRRRSGRK